MDKKLSAQLASISKDSKDKTLKVLINAFADKSFAILFLFLMAIPALPLPTGGVTHIFEIIVMLLSIEIIIGRKSIWLPKKWLVLKLPNKFWTRTIPTLIRLINKLEKITRPRMSGLVINSWFIRIVGVFVFMFSLFAFLAPPFSGLDTLPSLGVVLLSLGIIFEDLLILVIATIVGAIGISLVFLLGSLAFQLL